MERGDVRRRQHPQLFLQVRIPRLIERLRQLGTNTGTHFSGGRLRKGYHQELPNGQRALLVLQALDNALNQHRRLPGTRSGSDQ